MKKLITFMLTMVILFVSTCAFSEVDISGLSYDELVALKDKINLAIWNSQEWQEVIVPQGEWIVGEDIPAGVWTIKCADVNRTNYMMMECDFQYETKEFGTEFKVVYNPNHEDYENGTVTEITVELIEGTKFVVNHAYAPALFTPYAGKPSLGFQ